MLFLNNKDLITLLTKRYTHAIKKHPYTSFEALVSEVGELGIEVDKLRGNLSQTVPNKYYQNRIVDEAIDVAVVAIRIAKGELF